MSCTAFLSYSSKDRNLPQFLALRTDLRNLDVQVWWDDRLLGGQEWWDDILRNIARSDIFLVAISEKSLRSAACRRELEYARDTQRAILPVALTDASPGAVPKSLSSREIVRYTECTEGPSQASRCTAQLGKAIRALEVQGFSPAPEPLPAPPAIPPSYIEILNKYLDAVELRLPEQQQLLTEAKNLVNDDADDRAQLNDALVALLRRDDLSWKVRPELQAISDDLALSVRTMDQGDETTCPDGSSNRGERTKLLVRSFRAPGADASKVADQLARWYESQQLAARVSRTSSGSYTVTCSSAKARARFTGAGVRLETSIARSGDDLIVEISRQRWVDKAASATGGVALAAATSGLALPLVMPSIVGTYRQGALPGKTFQYIEEILPICRR